MSEGAPCRESRRKVLLDPLFVSTNSNTTHTLFENNRCWEQVKAIGSMMVVV